MGRSRFNQHDCELVDRLRLPHGGNPLVVKPIVFAESFDRDAIVNEIGIVVSLRHLWIVIPPGFRRPWPIELKIASANCLPIIVDTNCKSVVITGIALEDRHRA
jgi:hypothetical protein